MSLSMSIASLFNTPGESSSRFEPWRLWQDSVEGKGDGDEGEGEEGEEGEGERSQGVVEGSMRGVWEELWIAMWGGSGKEGSDIGGLRLLGVIVIGKGWITEGSSYVLGISQWERSDRKGDGVKPRGNGASMVELLLAATH